MGDPATFQITTLQPKLWLRASSLNGLSVGDDVSSWTDEGTHGVLLERPDGDCGAPKLGEYNDSAGLTRRTVRFGGDGHMTATCLTGGNVFSTQDAGMEFWAVRRVTHTYHHLPSRSAGRLLSCASDRCCA